MPRLPRAAAWFVLVIAVAGACSNAAPTASPQAQATAQPPASTLAPTAAPTAVATSPPASPAGSGSTSGHALKSLLPTTVGTHTLVSVEFSGAEFASSGAVSDQLKEVLAAMGRETKDLSMAIASDPSHGTDLSITAFRVNGVNVETFLGGYLPLLQSSYGQQAVTEGTRAGKNVLLVSPPGAPPQVLRPVGDVLFVVVGTDTTLVDQAVGLLP